VKNVFSSIDTSLVLRSYFKNNYKERLLPQEQSFFIKEKPPVRVAIEFGGIRFRYKHFTKKLSFCKLFDHKKKII